MIPEQLLHYIWQNKLFMPFPQQTSAGLPIEVIDVGMHNTDAGPDFFNAKLRIGDTMWAGNVEIHVKASDWKRHHHHQDKAYDNVILHVTQEIDAEVKRTDGSLIPQCELKYSPQVITRYQQWQTCGTHLPCEAELRHIPSIFIRDWMNALLIERLESKTQDIVDLLTRSENHWEETFYIILAHSFGFHTNSQPFEQLARKTPLLALAKHKNSLFQLEAMLFGQAGMLDTAADDYALSLQQEYNFLKQKFSLQGLDHSQWKMLRLRPANFPQVRIAQFAALLHNSQKLLSQLIASQDVKTMASLFEIQASAYWDTHCRFGEPSKRQAKKLGKAAINTILINTVIPCLFAYAQSHKNEALQMQMIDHLHSLPPEQNTIIKQWHQAGINAQSAADTQALLQLRHHYCAIKRCLHCRIGRQTLKTTSI